MIHILQTVRISSIKSFVLVNSVRKMMSPIFFFVPRSKYWKRKTSLFILPPSWWFIIFSIWHIRLSILLIQAVCGNSLAQRGVSVAQLQNIRARRSEVRLLATQHFFFFPCLWPDRKNFSHVSIQNKWAIRNYHIFFYDLEDIEYCNNSLVHAFLYFLTSIYIFWELFLVAWTVQTKKLWCTQKYWKLKVRDKQV